MWWYPNYLKPLSKPLNIIQWFIYTGRSPELLGGDIQNIKNIVNLRDALEAVIDYWNKIKLNNKYDSTWKKVAVMDIYEDQRPYTYEMLPDSD